MVDKLYQLDCEDVISEQPSVAISQVTSAADIWYFRLGMLMSDVSRTWPTKS